MNRIRKILLMGILLMTLVAWTTGCKKEAVDGKSTTPQVLTIANVDDLGSMNPHLYDSDMGGQSLVYEPLVNLDKKGNIVPWLAKSWDIQDNGCKIIMKLREDVKFTDGNVFNANVVKQNFDAILSEQVLDSQNYNGCKIIMKLKTS
jgi:nickel transport system substrate-binding protein